MPKQVLRVPSSNVALLIVLAVVFDVLMASVLGIEISGRSTGEVVSIVVILVAMVVMNWVLFRVGRQSIRLDGDDVIIRRYFSTQRVPRARIVAVDFTELDLTLSAGGDNYIPQVMLDGGDRVAVTVMTTASKKALAANLYKLGDFLGVPVHDRSEDTAADQGWSLLDHTSRPTTRDWPADDA